MHSLSRFALAMLAVTGSPSTATAESAPPPDQRATTQRPNEDREDAFRLRLSAALGAGNTEGALIAGGFRVMGGVEPSPLIFLGLSYRGIRGHGEDDGYSESHDTDMVSTVLELHPAGAYWVDPYVSVDMGYASYWFDSERDYSIPESRNGLAAAAGLGLSFRSKYVSGGPQFSYLNVPAAGTSALMVDLQVDLRF